MEVGSTCTLMIVGVPLLLLVLVKAVLRADLSLSGVETVFPSHRKALPTK